MHTLHVTRFNPDKLILAIRSVRAAGRCLGLPMTSERAARILDEVADFGHALVGQTESLDRAQEALMALADEVAGIIDATPEELRGPAPKLPRPSPEEVFAEVASEPEEDPFDTTEPKVWRTTIALMATAEGNPLIAAAHARTLYGTTDDSMYREVILCLATSFPHFLPEILRQQGFFESDESHT